jgi:hypothetical protein
VVGLENVSRVEKVLGDGAAGDKPSLVGVQHKKG